MKLWKLGLLLPRLHMAAFWAGAMGGSIFLASWLVWCLSVQVGFKRKQCWEPSSVGEKPGARCLWSPCLAAPAHNPLASSFTVSRRRCYRSPE